MFSLRLILIKVEGGSNTPASYHFHLVLRVVHVLWFVKGRHSASFIESFMRHLFNTTLTERYFRTISLQGIVQSKKQVREFWKWKSGSLDRRGKK